jgi:hypothetical protein
MAYTIELSPEEETIIERRAKRLGITPQEYVGRSVRRQLRATQPHLVLSGEEKQTLTAWNAQLSSDFWTRYSELSQKRRERSLSEAEQQEVQRLAAREEAWNVRRLQFLQEFAQKRGAPLLTFMRHNNIGHHPDADRFMGD